ncbi:MAG: SpoIIE family protein phosphatase [Bacteroidota bacterium]
MKRSFAVRLTLYILPLVSALFLIMLLVYYVFSNRVVTQSAGNNAASIAKGAVNKIEQVLQPVEKVAQSLAIYVETFDPDPESLTLMLKSSISRFPDVYGSAIAFGPYGKDPRELYFAPYAWHQGDSVALSWLGNQDYKYFYLDWFQIPTTLNRPYWSEPYFDEGGGNILMSTYSVPFYITVNDEHRVAGVVTADVALTWLTEIVESIQIYESGFAFLISPNGTLISHPDSALIMHESIFSIARERNEPSLRTIGRNMIAGKSELTRMPSEMFSNAWLYYLPIPSNQWSIGIVFPQKELFAGLQKMIMWLLILAVGGFLLLWIIILNVTKKVTVPLKRFASSAHEIAGGKFDVQLPEIRTADEMGELHHAFDYLQKQLAVYVENLRLTTAAKEKIESEMRIANQIQMGMIPKIFPPFPDRPEVDLHAMLKPAREVGGDLYDFFFIDQNKLCFAVGDVSGKGVPAALFMVVTRTLLRSVATKDIPLSELVFLLNNSLSKENESQMFVTFFIGILNLENGEVEYVNAGHNPPLVMRCGGSVSRLESTNDMALGFLEERKYHSGALQMNPGDFLVGYTDGVTEAENMQQVLYGDDRLKQILEQGCGSHPRDVVVKILEDVAGHVGTAPQSDDITVMVIKFKAKT